MSAYTQSTERSLCPPHNSFSGIWHKEQIDFTKGRNTVSVDGPFAFVLYLTERKSY